MAQYGSLRNQLMSQSSATAPPAELKVGDGMTEVLWSDRHAYTIIGFSESRQTVRVQRDNFHRTDDRGYYTESQNYRFESNPEGAVLTLRWSKKRGCYTHKGTPFWPGRQEYRDPSF
jgi:hypothetical protein